MSPRERETLPLSVTAFFSKKLNAICHVRLSLLPTFYLRDTPLFAVSPTSPGSILPVNGQPEHVDMDIDPVSQEVWPVNMESCGIQAEWACQQAISICSHVRSDVDNGMLPVNMILCLSTTDIIL